MTDQYRPKCVSCDHVLNAVDEIGRVACRRCEASVREHLDELCGPDGLFAQVVWLGTEALTPGRSGRGSNDPVVKTSKTSAPSPVVVSTVNLLGAGGVVHTLQRWVREWYADLGFRQPIWRGQHHFVVLVAPGNQKVRRPGQLDNTARALLNNLPWAAENRQDFGDFLRDVRGFVHDANSAVDPTATRPLRIQVGRCPGKKNDLVCNAQLMADPYAPAIRCANCGTSWPRRSWPSLRQAMRPGA